MESPEEMQALLLWLGEDEASGTREFMQIRQKLIVLFRYRGCYIPEELADETMDRSAQAVLKPGFERHENPIVFFRGVARNVYLEWLRKEKRFRTEPISEVDVESGKLADSQEPDDKLQICLERCLSTLPREKKTLLMRYYQSEKRAKIDERQLLAEELGIGVNALRIQVFRLRSVLRKCVDGCRAEKETQSPLRA
jgi:DNA-directed RNA polymerase specialized sigma24 family protein